MAAQKINACRQAAGEIILNGFVNKQFNFQIIFYVGILQEPNVIFYFLKQFYENDV